jgi:predicted PurR-regulated permease PerM
MIDSNIKFPFYAKAALVLVALYLFISMLSILQVVLLPLIYSVFIAILVSPLVNFLVKKNINRTIAILIVMLLFISILIGIVTIVIFQAGNLSDTFPQLKLKFVELFQNSLEWFSNYFNIDKSKIDKWILSMKSEVGGNSNLIIGNTLTITFGFIVTFILVPVYVFMLLIYQTHLLNFVYKVFGYSNDEKVSEILTETKSIIQLYIVGLFIEIVIVAILNSIGLLMLGINYAILLGIGGALLNIIPYLGGLVTMILFMLVALVTKEPIFIIYVVALYTIIQIIDNNFLVPKIVGSKVKLNALVSLMVVILGAALWGIPGMFLFIPLIAILKVIFDHIESLKPWGYLLGYDKV